MHKCTIPRGGALGYTSQQTVSATVFTSQAANGNSATFNNIGQSAHFLAYCTSAFVGNLQLAASPSGTYTEGILLGVVSYVNPNTGCHVMQAGGYFAAVRAQIVGYSAGSISAWYTGIASPIGFTPFAINSVGQTTPVICDQNATANVANSGTSVIVTGIVARPVVICAGMFSFAAAITAGGTITVEYGTGGTCGTGTGIAYVLYVATGDPLIFPLGVQITVPAGNIVCIINGANQQMWASISFAQFSANSP